MSGSYSLLFRSALSVFTGLGVAGLVDRTVVRTAAGLPYVPGSTVKGRWRWTAERLLRGAGRGQNTNPLWVHHIDAAYCKEWEGGCTVCRIFGNPALPAALQVGDAHLSEEWRDLFEEFAARSPRSRRRSAPFPLDTEVRPGVALSRVRGVAQSDCLFFDEAVPAVFFTGEWMLDRAISDAEWQFLVAVAGAVDGLGARKGGGRGMLDGGIVVEGQP